MRTHLCLYVIMSLHASCRSSFHLWQTEQIAIPNIMSQKLNAYTDAFIQTLVNRSHAHRPVRRHPHITRTFVVFIFSFLGKSQRHRVAKANSTYNPYNLKYNICIWRGNMSNVCTHAYTQTHAITLVYLHAFIQHLDA